MLNQAGDEVGHVADLLAEVHGGETYPVVTGIVIRVGRRRQRCGRDRHLRLGRVAPPVNLITLLVGTQVLQGIVTPVILAYILILANRRSLLGGAANGPVFRIAATVCTVAISAMSLLLLGFTVLGFFRIG